MQCPICDIGLSSIVHHDVEIESCSQCSGAWFDRNELSLYLEKRSGGISRSVSPEELIMKSNSDFVIKDGGFCPKCNQIVEETSLTDLRIKTLKCFGCQGIWVRISHLSLLAKWYANASPMQKLSLFDQKFRTWDAVSDAPLIASLLNLFEDENPRRAFPWATVSLLIINLIIFTWYFVFPEKAQSCLLVPSLFFDNPLAHFPQVFTSMFMHANIFHLIGNMYFLWVFGDNIEDRIGPLKYILLYLICGIVAGISHALATNNPEIPALGASGAVSGILGGYLLLYPKARVSIFTLLWFQPHTFTLPVWFYLGVWFFGQQWLNVAMNTSGVAWYAHISGFIFGFLTLLLMRKLRRL